MIFHSLDYAVFLLVVFSVYWALPHRAQNVFLLAASYVFYGYVHPWFVILLATSTVVDYTLALAMTRSPKHRKLLLGLSLMANLGLLGFFKYFGFFVENVWSLLQALGIEASRPMLKVMLPVGISFYTFQTLSYTIDVYRGKLEARRNLIDFATFLSLFPQLVAGPIERATHLLPQVENPRRFDPEAARPALVLLGWGVFKKVVIADNVAVIANKVFAIESPGFALLWVGTLAFTIQIYADFSAYSDIARASARLLGFDLMKNFDHPYISQTPAEFWRRWHISLSTWFRDYVYIPLGGNRGSALTHYRNLALTFLLSGLWHGASWNYVIWGAYHGVLLITYQLLARIAPRLLLTRWLTVPRVVVFFALTNLGWLIFRETSIERLAADLALRPGSDSPEQLAAAGYFLGTIVVYALPLCVDMALDLTGVTRQPRHSLRWVLLQGAALGLLIVGMALLYSDVPSDFIYFQF